MIVCQRWAVFISSLAGWEAVLRSSWGSLPFPVEKRPGIDWVSLLRGCSRPWCARVGFSGGGRWWGWRENARNLFERWQSVVGRCSGKSASCARLDGRLTQANVRKFKGLFWGAKNDLFHLRFFSFFFNRVFNLTEFF